MIYHLHTTGTPVSWSIAAIYEKSLGIASEAARNWHSRHDSIEALIRVEREDDGSVRKAECVEIFWVKQDRQDKDTHGIFVSGFKDIVDDDTRSIIEELLRQAMIAQGYLIPPRQWAARYPASKIVSDRFRDFNRAYEDHKKAGTSRDEFFEDRWIMFMERPRDHVLAYTVKPRGKGYGIEPGREGLTDPTQGKSWREIEDANAYCRHLNSGFSWEEAQILMRPEPVEAPYPIADQALDALDAHLRDVGDDGRHDDLRTQIEEEGERAFNRSNMRGHVTSSMMVVRLDTMECLLIEHLHHQLWLAPGGHYETGTLLESALREVEEETGLTDVEPVLRHPIHIDTHPITARPAKNEGEHFHSDYLYGGIARGSTDLVAQEDEVAGADWKPLEEVARWKGHAGDGARRMISILKEKGLR